MARPLVSGGLVLALMLGLAYPLTQLNFAFGSVKYAPQNIESVAGYTFVKDHFATTSDPTRITLQSTRAGSLRAADQVAAVRAPEQQPRTDPEVGHVVGPSDFIAASGRSNAQQQSQLGHSLTTDNQTESISVIPRHVVGAKQAEWPNLK